MTARELARSTWSLARRPAVAISLGLAAVGGGLLTRLPLFEVPGYELASAMGAFLLPGAAIAGICAARRERAQAPAGLRRAFLSAWLCCLLALIPPFLAAVLGAFLGSRCSPWSGVAFYLILPVPSAALAVATGNLAGFAFKCAWAAGLCFGLIALGSVAASVWPVWDGPQIFALNPLLGYYPGPIYDELLPVESRLLVHRGLTLAWTGLVLLGTSALLDRQTARLSRKLPAPPWRSSAAIIGLVACLALGQRFEFELGLRTRESNLDVVLGGLRRTAHFVLHFPRAKPQADVDRLERDLEFDYEQVVAFLGDAPKERIDAFFYAGPDQKRRLVGAADTCFAKPWRLQFHVQDDAFPHPVARHEMAHVVGQAFGTHPLGFGTLRVGLIEGLATAADDRLDELTLHQWAAAMRRVKQAPNLRETLGPTGFYKQASAKAYTLSGSFLRYLADRFGSAKLRQVYGDGDFDKAYGQSLDSLATQWEAFLDAMPLTVQALHVAQNRFGRGSIFERPCAREMARRLDEAEQMRWADPDLALSLYDRCAKIEPDNPTYPRAKAEIYYSRRQWHQARVLWEQILEHPGTTAQSKAQVLLGLGDTEWAADEIADARKAFADVLDLQSDGVTHRYAAMRLSAIDDPLAGPIIRRYFKNGGGELVDVVALSTLAHRQPANAYARYLVGRQLHQHGDHENGARWLEEALLLGIPDEEIRREASRVLVQSLYLAGDLEGAVAAAEPLASGDESDRGFAAQWRARCAFEQRVFGAPLLPTR